MMRRRSFCASTVAANVAAWLVIGVVAAGTSPLRATAIEPETGPDPLTADERDAYVAELQSLQARLAALREAPNISPDRWADAAVFVKGVVWALDFGPVADARSRGLVRFGLDRAKERINDLAAGRHPWTERRGRTARGFISAIDDSVQPYCLVIPESYDPARPTRLDVVLHGSCNSTGIGELLYLEASDSGVPAAPSTPYVEIHPMGRLGENAYRFEGETDVGEAIEAVCRDYNIDRRRIVLRGHSLGGVGTWQLGLKRPDRYVAIGPGSGPVDTIEFSKSPWEHFVRLEPLTPWQEKMLPLVDAIDYAPNAGITPIVAVMGDQDPYYSSHLLIEQAFAKEGLALTSLVDRGAGHSITAAMIQQQLDQLGAIADRGADPFPNHIRFVTWTLKFSRCRWIEVLGLEAHYQRAEIDAQIDDDGQITLAEPINITRFAVHPPALSDQGGVVTIGGQQIAVPASESRLARPMVFEKRDGNWRCTGPLDSTRLTGKRPGLQGPIDDAFAERFLCVRGTGNALNPVVSAWAEANLRRFADEWRRHYHGYLPVKNDTEVTEDDVRRSNLILFGDPGSNQWIAKVLPHLPLQWTPTELRLGPETHSAADHGVQLIHPNPLPGGNGRYVVLNSGHTYHDPELRFSYMVFPRLGDWAIMKVGGKAPKQSAPPIEESVINSGFFNEDWCVPVSR